MYNIAIVEDDRIMREHIISIINHTIFETQLGYKIYSYDSAECFLQDFNQRSFHVLLLDIELPGMSGIDLAHSISKLLKKALIVFMTSYEGYMKNAFGINVERYILKADCDQELPAVLKEILHRFETMIFKVFKTPGGVIHVGLDDILYVEFIGRNPHVMTIEGKSIVLSATSLKSIYRDLDSDAFLLINNQTIINMTYITELTNKHIMLKKADREFRLSRNKSKEIMDTYQHYLLKGNTL